MNDRQSIAAKIRAILAKCAPGSGATEGEVLSAAAKAEELMQKYRLSPNELEPEAEGVEKLVMGEEPYWGVYVRYELQTAISLYCGVKTWRSSSEKKLTYFGMASDVIFAEWLQESLVALVHRAVHDYELSLVLEGKNFGLHDQRGVVLGCCAGLNDKLNKAYLDRKAKEQMEAVLNGHSRNQLVVTRNSLVDREFGKLGLQLYRSAGRHYSGSADGARYGQGKAAGATFNRPVGGSAGPKLLK